MYCMYVYIKVCTCILCGWVFIICTFVYVLMRDDKEEASKVKQTTKQSNTAHTCTCTVCVKSEPNNVCIQCTCTYILVPYISGNSKAPSVGTLPMFCIEKHFCACTAQRIVWRLQNRILVSVKIKLQAITSGNVNRTRPYMVIYSTAPWAINNIPAPKAGPQMVRVQVSCIIVCTVSGIVPPLGFHVLPGLRLGSTCAALVQYISHTLYKL